MVSTSPKAVTDLREFLGVVRKSGLVNERSLKAFCAGFPASGTVAQAAKQLVDAGILSAFQAERIASGKSDGFLIGQYAILERIGDAATGQVFKARHRTMNRLAAIELFAPEQSQSEANRQAFEQVTRAVAQLVHPNIITTYDANRVGNRSYVVMEFVDGDDLATVVRNFGPLPIDIACEYVRQVASGLQFAHARNMVHGAIHPGHMQLRRNPDGHGLKAYTELKIRNFGYDAFERTTGTEDDGVFQSTTNPIEYASPEQLRPTGPITVAADLFSLGCTFYFMLTGRAPAPVNGNDALHQFSEIVPANQIRAGIPPYLVELLRALMAREPADRIASADLLLERIAPYAASGHAIFHPQIAVPTPPEDASPFALPEVDIESGIARGYSVDSQTPISTRTRPNRVPAKNENAWHLPLLVGLAMGVILATGLAIAFVLRSVGR